MQINSYSFGRIVIEGKEFKNDVIVSGDAIINPKWWRKEGHNVHPEDIGEILNANPEIVIFGTGASGIMRVSGEVQRILKERGIKIIQQLTKDAVKTFNEMVREGKKVVFAAHLTC